MLCVVSSTANFMGTFAHEQHGTRHFTSDEKVEVRSQLDRLLRSTHFRNSRRYPALLRHIVEETLEGRGLLLKERTLGVEVFDRPPDYDTASDPIVRVTVAEIRKRIAQYYHDDAHGSELRIELVPGSYLPEFIPGRLHPYAPQVPGEEEHAAGAGLAIPAPLLAPAGHSSPAQAAVVRPHRLSRTGLRWFGASLLILLAVCGAAGWRYLRPTPLGRLWAPLFAADGPITFCLPISVRKNGAGNADTTAEAIAHVLDLADTKVPASGTFFEHEILGENVVYSDVLAMMKLESVVERQHRPVRVRLNLGTNLNDLREGPAIFLGGLDNQWTLKLLAPLRFRFSGSDADVYYILDANHPENRQWSVRLRDKYSAVNRDYAIVARVHSKELGHIVMIAAGVGMSGTAAAGEFLSEPAQVAELQRRLGGDSLRDRDFEVVLQTDVDDGIAGPAQIVAVDVQ